MKNKGLLLVALALLIPGSIKSDGKGRVEASESCDSRVEDDGTHIGRCIELLVHSEVSERRQALEALRQIDKPAIPPLIDALNDRRETIREAASSALTEMGAEAAPDLIESLDKNRPWCARRPLKPLVRLAHQRRLRSLR